MRTTGTDVTGCAQDLAGLGTPPEHREVEIAGRTGSLMVVVTGAALDLRRLGRRASGTAV